ncbi:hypothetical protein ABU614_10200 [Lysobacter firmicutimachus]|uniref:Uncharacterized protein n=1 Tax=Lysobacter firmicutimachus TaxID=1792846 RepID=A0AAU8N0Z2_9GAMM
MSTRQSDIYQAAIFRAYQMRGISQVYPDRKFANRTILYNATPVRAGASIPAQRIEDR